MSSGLTRLHCIKYHAVKSTCQILTSLLFHIGMHSEYIPTVWNTTQLWPPLFPTNISQAPGRFTVYIQHSNQHEPHEIAMCVDARFWYNNDTNTVVRNHKQGSWGQEERGVAYFPFAPNVPFEMIILVEPHQYKVESQTCVRVARAKFTGTHQLNSNISIHTYDLYSVPKPNCNIFVFVLVFFWEIPKFTLLPVNIAPTVNLIVLSTIIFIAMCTVAVLGLFPYCYNRFVCIVCIQQSALLLILLLLL